VNLDLKTLFEKMRRIEALHAGATTPGERDAAANAIKRMRERMKTLETEDPPVEYKFALGDSWSRKLFLAIVRRYGLKPYRHRGQRYTTVMVRVSKRFVDRTLWPEFVELDAALREALDRATDDVIAKVFEQQASEAEVRDGPHLIGAVGADADGD
jgi:flavin-binding protein dodecin